MARSPRKAVSSLIGTALFFTILFTTGAAYFAFVLDGQFRVQQAFNDGVDLKRQQLLEEFDTSVSLDGSNQIALTVVNTGPVPITIRQIILDKADGVEALSVQEVVNPGENANINTNSTYSSGAVLVKTVTDRGGAASYLLSSVSDATPMLNLYVSPASPINNTDISILFTVTNGENDTDALSDLVPVIQTAVSTGTQITLNEGPTPASSGVLPKGTTAFFRWVYNVVGDKGDWVFFNATVQGAPQGNFAVTNITLTTVSFAEQSSLALSSSNFAMGNPSASGRLYWHRDTELNGYPIDPIEPPSGGSPEQITLSSGNTTIRFYMKNGTENISVPSGDWDLHLDSYRVNCDSCSMQIRILYEIVTEDGQTAVQTIDDYARTLNGDEYDWDSTTISRPQAALNITAGNRIRLTITHQSGTSLDLRFDRMNNDNAYLETPDPDIPYPAYFTYDGDDFWIRVTNDSGQNYWMIYQTRAVWSDLNSNQSYASFLIGWQDPSGPPEYSIDENRDTMVRRSGEGIMLHFTQPRSIPTRSANDGDPITSGTYRLTLLIVGYDEYGAFLIRMIEFGTVTW